MKRNTSTTPVPPVLSQTDLVRRSIQYFKPERSMIGILLSLIGASVLLNLLNAWPVAVLVDTVLSLNPKSDRIHQLFLAPFGEHKLAQVVGVAAAGMLIKVTQDAVWAARSILNNRIMNHGTARLRCELFAKLQDLNIGWHRSRSQGDTLYRISYDTKGPWGILDTLIGSGAACVTLTAMTIIMLSRSVWLTVFALSITPFLALANGYFGKRMRTGAAQAKQADANLVVNSQRVLGCIPIVQAFCRQTSESERFGRTAKEAVDASMRLAWAESLYPFAVQTIFAAGGAVIFGYGGYLVYRDQFLAPVHGGVTCGDLLVFMAYLGQLWDPLGWVIGFPAKIQTHSAACERVFSVLDERPAVSDLPGALRLPLRARTLSLENVTFSYGPTGNGQNVLDDITVRIPPGQMVAFVGGSGAGKTTLLSLLARFFDPASGSVRLDGKDIRKFKLADVRRHLAVASQDSVLFADTIASNLRYGKPDADEDALHDAVVNAGALDFIRELPDRFDSMINEGGQNLSGGQKQRLAIARALVSEAPILVLDEPTSALDPGHEQWVMNTLRRLKRKKTVILVTHRIESAKDCDQICVLEGGRIKEQGTHELLLRRNGTYASMYRSSTGHVAASELRKVG